MLWDFVFFCMWVSSFAFNSLSSCKKPKAQLRTIRGKWFFFFTLFFYAKLMATTKDVHFKWTKKHVRMHRWCDDGHSKLKIDKKRSLSLSKTEWYWPNWYTEYFPLIENADWQSLEIRYFCFSFFGQSATPATICVLYLFRLKNVIEQWPQLLISQPLFLVTLRCIFFFMNKSNGDCEVPKCDMRSGRIRNLPVER